MFVSDNLLAYHFYSNNFSSVQLTIGVVSGCSCDTLDLYPREKKTDIDPGLDPGFFEEEVFDHHL